MAAGLLVGVILALALPAGAGEIYSWRTEDGGYAFAGERKNVPARYRDQIEVRRTEALGDYRRFTAQDDTAARRYEERLAERLERLRELNRPRPAAEGSGASSRDGDYVTIRGGSNRGGGVDVSTPLGRDAQPLETETIFMKRKDSDVVQPVRITRRGKEIVSISKPRNSQWNISDFEDEEDLLVNPRD
jgi:hypothetical protein